MRIVFDPKRCKQCGLCIALCPKSVFDKDIDGGPLIAREKDCVICRQCERRCPDFALQVISEEGGK